LFHLISAFLQDGVEPEIPRRICRCLLHDAAARCRQHDVGIREGSAVASIATAVTG
jgi:hypothetical protein